MAQPTRNLGPRHFFTARKAASGLGAAHAGTAAHWAMTVSSVALAILTPAFLLVIGAAIGLIMVAVMMAITSMNAVVG